MALMTKATREACDQVRDMMLGLTEKMEHEQAIVFYKQLSGEIDSNIEALHEENESDEG